VSDIFTNVLRTNFGISEQLQAQYFASDI